MSNLVYLFTSLKNGVKQQQKQPKIIKQIQLSLFIL